MQPELRQAPPAVRQGKSQAEVAAEVAEEEANVFAALILMPTRFFEADAAGLDITDEQALRVVARRYDVSTGLVVYRMALRQRLGH